MFNRMKCGCVISVIFIDLDLFMLIIFLIVYHSIKHTKKKQLKTKNTMHADYPNRNNIIVSIQKIP